ncbi:MAG TPA: fumarylacetoacetate hydrolase family protein [Thermoleophilia bacterium]|nr:fumarylacetoacetate hydrolase family protein [Thermoleophilia bacterium]
MSALPHESALPFGRVLVAGEARHCLFEGQRVRLLDGPAYEAGTRETGEVGLGTFETLVPVLPTKIVCVGLNYRAHAAEFDEDVPEEPLLFIKPPSAVVGPAEAIVLPGQSQRVDYEAELALVLGRRCRDVRLEEAAGFVAGYTCGNDVTARDLQARDGQWARAKSFDTFCPLGPVVVRSAPADDAVVAALLDGVEVQRGLVGDMLFSPLDLLVFVSAIMTLEPGDVIMTGTPPGVGPLRVGQTVTIQVDGVGSLTNPVA